MTIFKTQGLLFSQPLFRLFLALIFGGTLSTAASAQSVDNTFEDIERIQKQGPALQRAMNLARAKAISLNGGLGKYMPEKCMFSTMIVRKACLVEAKESGFLFRFSGGQPGWEVKGLSPTVKTEIKISSDGRMLQQIVNEPVDTDIVPVEFIEAPKED